MGRINWWRVVLSGLITGVAWTVTSSVVTVLAGRDFASAVPDNRLAAPNVGFVTFLFCVNLAEGIWMMWLYAMTRPRYSSRLKAALMMGMAWWIISSLIDATWGSFGFVPAKALLGPMVASLPAILLAVLVGAWMYKE